MLSIIPVARALSADADSPSCHEVPSSCCRSLHWNCHEKCQDRYGCSVFPYLSWLKGWWDEAERKDRRVSWSKEKIARKEQITPHLRLECIFKTCALQLQINISLICQLVVPKMWEPKLWYHPVTPRSRGYGVVTVTYIRRSEYPHVYKLIIIKGKNQSAEAQ